MVSHNSQIETLGPVEQIQTFANKIFHRADGFEDVVPADHRPDWGDRPARFRLYPDLPRIPLLNPSRLVRTYETYASKAGQETGASPSAAQLSALLYLMAGPLRRKLDMNWNNDPSSFGFMKQEYGRGSASGGGLYPVQLYLAAGEHQELKPGVYHYSAVQHALVGVRHGDWTSQLAHAVGIAHRGQERYPYYLVLGVDFWTNCFKYHNFGYHVCSEDTGVMLGTLGLAAGGLTLANKTFLTFNDRLVNEALGANGRSESAFAIVGLGTPTHEDADQQPAVRLAQDRSVRMPWQRSAKVTIPAELIRMHELTLLDSASDTNHIGSDVSWGADTAADPLSGAIRQSLPSILMSRRSAWSSMHGDVPLEGNKLQQLLRFVWGRFSSQPAREPIPSGSLDLVLRVNNIRGLKDGVYRWEPTANALTAMASEPTAVWQSTYSMHNYNIDEANCTLLIVGDLPKVLAAYGARGYRVLNAYVGMVAQWTYVAAAALGLDCGAVLGVRAQRVKRTLQLEENKNVFLAIYLSESQQRPELFRFELLPEVPTWKTVS